MRGHRRPMRGPWKQAVASVGLVGVLLGSAACGGGDDEGGDGEGGSKRALAARLAAGPTVAYRAVKAVLATAATDSLEQTLDLEARLQAVAGRTADHREAVEAFLAKRPAVFTGH